MPLCTVCTNPRRHAIDAALLEHTVGYRVVASRFGLAKASVQRHEQFHLAEQLRQAKETRQMLSLVSEKSCSMAQ